MKAQSKAHNFLSQMASIMIKKYRVVYLAMVLVLIAGLFSYDGLTKEVLPEMKFPYAVVTVPYGGATPEDVVDLVTTKVEEAVSGSGDIKSIESTAYHGLSQTVIKYNLSVDLSDKLNKLRSEMEDLRSDLPKGAGKPSVGEYDFSKIPTMIINLKGRIQPHEMKTVSEQITRSIRKVSGVSKVKVSGLQKREVRIDIEPAVLAQYGVTEDDIDQLLKSRNLNLPAGTKEFHGKKMSVRVESQFQDLDQIGNIVVKTNGDFPLYLKDISQISYVVPESAGKALSPVDFKTENEKLTDVVSIIVSKEKATDTIRINKEIKAILDRMEGDQIPQGVHVDIALDMSTYIQKSISTVFENALSGLLVVVIVLFFFIDFRESLIVAMVIPLSMLMSVAVFKLVGVSFNVMSLMGLIIALGMLVDNAIVVIESIQIAKKKYSDMNQAAAETTKSVAAAIFASTLTTVLAFLPLLLMTGDEAPMIKPIPIAASLALGASFIVSILVTPAISARWLKQEPKSNKFKKWTGVALVFVLSLFAFSNKGDVTLLGMIASPLFAIAIWYKLFKAKKDIHHAPFIEKYASFMAKILSSSGKRWLAIGLSTLVFLGSVGLLASDLVKKQAMPSPDQTQLEISYDLDTASTLADSEAIARELQTLFSKKDYVKTYTIELSSGGGTVHMILPPKVDRDLHSNDIALDLKRDFKAIPGATFEVGLGENASTQMTLVLTGSQVKDLKTTGRSFVNQVKGIDGVEDAWISGGGGYPQLTVRIDFEKAALLNMNVSQVSSDVRNVILGREITQLRRGDVVEPIKLYYAGLRTLTDLEQMSFSNMRGDKVPFQSFASLEEEGASASISRKNNQNVSHVVIQLKKDAVMNSIVKETVAKVRAGDIVVDPGIKWSFGGAYESMQDSFKDLGQKLLIAVVLIFTVLVIQFNSYKQPFVILMAVPMAVIGVALGHFLTGISFGTMSFMGLVALAGIVVNDSIVLIDTVNQNRDLEAMGMVESIVEAVRSRFIPVLATSITTIAGVLPLALYNEDYSQMAWTLIFGLTASTVLILALVPIILAQLEAKKVKGESIEKVA